MKSYGKILGKVVAGFLGMYLVMMSIFTYSKQIDVRKEYENHIFDVLHTSEQSVQEAYTKENIATMTESNIVVDENNKSYNIEGEMIASGISWGGNSLINEMLTRKIKYGTDFKVFGAAAVFKYGECIARSGNYLTCSAVDWNLNPIEGGNKYIDLEKYLSKQEVLALLEKIREIREDSNKIIWIRAGGYSNGNEILPTLIEVLEISRRDEYGWRDEDAQMVKSYEFKQEGNEELEEYYSDNWEIESPIDLARYTTGNGEKEQDYMVDEKMTEKTFNRIKALEAKLYEWNEEVANRERKYSWERKWNEVTYSTYQQVETETGIYNLALGMQYAPWSIAMYELKLVYVFSGIAGLIMSMILTLGLWRTEKKQQLLEKNRRMLIDAIGHELKTPLGIISSYSEGLKEKIAEEKREHYLDVIMDETHRMNALILEMLNLSKLESGAYKLKLEHFKINDLLRASLKNKEKLFEDGQIQLVLEDGEALEVAADYSCIEKVINNILMNAISHTPVNGKIAIKIEGRKVSIENEGESIPEEKLKAIWQSFYKAEKIENRSGEGTGLGLAIVKEILELHGWKYGAKNIEGGVSFWFEVK